MVIGRWIGVAAEQLGLSGKVRADDFLRLCENQHPKTGETLTQRLNSVRMDEGKEVVTSSFGLRFGEQESEAEAERQRERSRSETAGAEPQAERLSIIRHLKYSS